MRSELRHRIWLLLFPGLLATVACTGTIDPWSPAPEGSPGASPTGPTGPGGGGLPPHVDGTVEQPGPSPRFVRLTHRQWTNTIQDLFNVDASELASTFRQDPRIGRFETDARRLNVSQGLVGDYREAAEQVAAMAVQSTAFVSSTDEEPRPLVESLLSRVFRRPLRDEEIARYVAVVEEGPSLYPDEQPRIAGLRHLISAALQSPHFVYRVELTPPGSALDAVELANRLSYFLWNTMPDEELTGAATSGGLNDEQVYLAQLERLLSDPRAESTLASFHHFLFKTESFDDTDKREETFPEWSDELKEAMRTEAELFLDSVVESGTAADLFLSQRAFVNADLAPIYGVDVDATDGWVETELSADRPGFFTRAGFLAKNATLGEMTDPIHRGAFVNMRLLCRNILAPNLPPDLPDPVGNTTREQVDSITGEGTCGSTCHANYINPVGFALESFDSLGRWRDEENGHPVDTRGEYTFSDGPVSFEGARELAESIAVHPDFHHCYSSHLLAFSMGRDPLPEDEPLVDRIGELSLGQNTIKELVAQVALSTSFRMRSRAEMEAPAGAADAEDER